VLWGLPLFVPILLLLLSFLDPEAEEKTIPVKLAPSALTATSISSFVTSVSQAFLLRKYSVPVTCCSRVSNAAQGQD